MKKILGMTTLAATVLAAGLAWAAVEPQRPDRPGRGEARFQRMAEYLGLTEEQQATWKSLHEQQKTEMEPLMQEGRELHQRLRTAMDAQNPDPAAVGAATLALKQHREKVKAAHEAFGERLKGVLSDEQKAKFEAFKTAHRAGPGRRGGFKGHRGPKGGRPAESTPAAPTRG
ncbi:MAG TPA: periplasmic heavy metal sensor [Vicinamibacteria bacterium]